jgi:uridine kinase
MVGGSGSGKTWLSKRLCGELGLRAARLSLDDFYCDLSVMPLSERDQANFDDPAAIDWDAVRVVMDTLTSGQTAQVPVYEFTTHTRRRATRRFAPRALVLWDGLWLLHEAAMRERFAHSLFVDCSEAERLARRVARDVRERGRTEESVRCQFANHVQPMHAKFVEPQRSLADQVITSPVSAAMVADLKMNLFDLIGAA